MHSPIAMKGNNIFYIDNNQEDLQLCATLVDDIYKNLREAEVIDSCRCHCSFTTFVLIQHEEISGVCLPPVMSSPKN
jgi:hypothetical protein